MKQILASVGITAAIFGGTIAPAFAADTPIAAEITYISSGSSQVSSPVTVKGAWSAKKLEVGQTFTVKSDVINWAYDFPFTLNDGTQIGKCTTDKGTLTCTVDNVPNAVAAKTDISGIWWTTARLQESVVGKKWGEISIGGQTWPFAFGDKDWDSACDNDCNGGHYEDAKPEDSKWGWVNPDGTTSWMITWVAEPGVKYSVHDAYTKLSTSVKCAKGDTWDPSTTVYISAIPVNDYTIEFTAPEGVKTCVTYTPEPMATPAGAKTATNVAYVNSIKLERTIEVEVRGGTTGDGTTPSPAPNPTTTTPVPLPSPSVETPVAPQSGTPSPSAKPSPSETPIPSTRPTTKAETPKTSETKLAKTGFDPGILLVLVPLTAAFGVVIYIASRKEDI